MEIEKIKEQLQALAADTPASFGVMTPQHMVEHLTVTVKISYNRIKIPEFEPSEKQKSQKIALLDTPLDFPKGMLAPGIKAGELMPLKNDNLCEAKEQLLNSLANYHTYFTNNPTATTVHPRFGPLTYGEWEKFHPKHFKHHFEQFGIWND
jgi:hypothetical protein